jgi:hypothetical protein
MTSSPIGFQSVTVRGRLRRRLRTVQLLTVTSSNCTVLRCHPRTSRAHGVGSEYRILGLTSRLWVLVFDHAAMWYSLVSPSRIGLR